MHRGLGSAPPSHRRSALALSRARPRPLRPRRHVQPRIETCLRAEGKPTGSGRIPYAGRPPSASTATGFGSVHAQEQAKLISEALDVSFRNAW